MVRAGKDKDETSRNNNKIRIPKKSTDFNYTISESAIVMPDARELRLKQMSRQITS
jgi:hypothetical protein